MQHAPAGPLGHVVEQLWAPALATGSARVQIGERHQDAGWRDVERYLVLPSLDRATMLLPRQPRQATAGALMNYRGLRRLLPNAQRTLLGTLAGAGAPLPFPRLSVQVRRDAPAAVAPELPLAMLARQLALPEVFASIGVRTGANRKATLQLVDAEGAPRGFAKMAWGPASDQGVRLEAAALGDPVTSGPARTPRLLAQGSYYEHPYIVTAPLPLGCRGVRADIPAPTPQELFALCPIVRTDRCAGTGQLQDLRARVAAAPRDTDSGPVLDAAADLVAVVEEAEAEVPVTSRWHGDLTPWNSARDEDGILWCWDWESSEADAVAGMDALHWHVTVATEGGRPLGATTLTDAHQRAQSHLVAAGIPRSAHGLVTALYAATLAERACTWAVGGGGWERGWVLPHQLVDLLAAARTLVAGPVGTR